jgi:hypothetical protein
MDERYPGYMLEMEFWALGWTVMRKRWSDTISPDAHLKTRLRYFTWKYQNPFKPVSTVFKRGGTQMSVHFLAMANMADGFMSIIAARDVDYGASNAYCILCCNECNRILQESLTCLTG